MVSGAVGAAFKDTWTLSDLDVAWIGLFADEQPAVCQVLETAPEAHAVIRVTNSALRGCRGRCSRRPNAELKCSLVLNEKRSGAIPGRFLLRAWVNPPIGPERLYDHHKYPCGQRRNEDDEQAS